MKEFDDLIATTDHLLGPKGCPWDREQTLKSTRPCIIEEASELVDAIDSEESQHIKEELGDLLFVVIFLCRLAEKEQQCNLSQVLKEINSKLIRRHPHVFGDAKIETSEELLVMWSKIKDSEKGKEHRKSVLDSIPKGLPALARAQKVQKKIKKSISEIELPFQSEEELGQLLFEIAAIAYEKGIDAEHALRKTLVSIEHSFRSTEHTR